jgi:xanthine dehydrogenase accessory factor
MYEIIRNIRFIKSKVENDQATVIATIFKTVGSSYRKQWTQMVVAEDMTYAGALSGGCVEREVLRQANKLFYSKGRAQFEYDGTEKLGCKGRIWVCLEYLSKETAPVICEKVEKAHRERNRFIHGIGDDGNPYTYFNIDGEVFPFNGKYEKEDHHLTREILPQNRLVIVGGEFDSFILARTAQWSGFDTHLVVYKDYVKPSYNPSYQINRIGSEQISDYCRWDERTALILMTHSMERDYTYLNQLLNQPISFIGALGPSNRKDELIQRCKEEMDLNSEMMKRLMKLKGPVGIHIEARTPEEIAVSIVSELIQEFNTNY